MQPNSESSVVRYFRGLPQATQDIGNVPVEEDQGTTTLPVVSLRDHRHQGLNQQDHTKGIKKRGQQLLKRSHLKQSLAKSFGGTRPQSTQDKGNVSVEEDQGTTTLPVVSQLNHRPQGLNQQDHTKGPPEKYDKNQPGLQGTNNNANLQYDHNQPSEQLGPQEQYDRKQPGLQESNNKAYLGNDHIQPSEHLGTQVAAILIEGFDKDKNKQEVFQKDTCLVRETLTSIIGVSPKNVFCIQLVKLEDTVEKLKDIGQVKCVFTYYSGHFYKERGFESDNDSFISKKKFEQLLSAIKQDIVLVTDCCFSGQLNFSIPNIKIQIGATGPEEQTRFDHSGSIFTKIFIHCLKEELSSNICEKLKPEEIRNGLIPVTSLEKNIKAHMMKININQPFQSCTPFLRKRDPGDCYIF